jgi:hypothetical protein
MTRTSTVILQGLIIAIFVSSLFFFGMAVSRAEAMLDTNGYEAMPVPEPRAVGEGTTWHFDADCMPEDPLSCGDEDDSL